MMEIATSTQHRNWVDALRAIGIVLVVLGHTLGIGDGVDKYIFSFHMPLFFFLSGFVLTGARLSQSMVDTVRHYGRRLLVPYALFSILTYIPWVLITRRYGSEAPSAVEVWRPLVGTFYGIGIDGWLQHNAMLWFFPCLFVLHVVFHELHRRFRGGRLWVFTIVLTGIGWLVPHFVQVRLPWGAEVALIALPFYALGHYFSSKEYFLPGAKGKLFPMFIAFSALQYGCILLNGRVDMNFISLGNPLLFYLGAMAGIGAVACLAVFLTGRRYFAQLASAAVVIFPLHRVMFSVFSAIGMLLVSDLNSFKSSVWGSVTYTIGALVVGLALLPLVRKWCPALIGGR